MAKTAEGFWTAPAATRRDLRTYGLTMAAVLGAVSGLLWYREVAGAWPWTGGAAALFLVLATAWPTPLKPLYAAWMMLARVLGFVNSHLLLGLVFFLMFTPLGLVMRLVRRDPLQRGGFRPTDPACRPGAAGAPGPDGDGSLWRRREPEVLARDHFERQF